MKISEMGETEKEESEEIEKLPTDILSHIFFLFSTFTDLAQASCVCKKWREGVKQSLGRRQSLSFYGCKMDDASTSRLVHLAFSLKELDISRSRWGCQITDYGLFEISMAKCISNLTSISIWGMTGITDKGVVQLVSRATSLQNLNIGGTFITDESLFAIGNNCLHLKVVYYNSVVELPPCDRDRTSYLVNKCRKLQSINVWGTRVPLDCFIGLRNIAPALQIKPIGLLHNAEAITV